MTVESVDIKDSPFAKYKKSDWMFYFTDRYGQFTRPHQKAWVIDQVNRIYFNTPLIICLAKWENGDFEYSVRLGEPSKKYLKWVKKQIKDGYNYDEGISP